MGQVIPRRRFAAKVRLGLALLLLISMVLIGQHVSKLGYQAGLVLMAVVVVLGFTFNNIAPQRAARQTVIPLIMTWVIVAALFALGIVLAPILTGLGT